MNKTKSLRKWDNDDNNKDEFTLYTLSWTEGKKPKKHKWTWINRFIASNEKSNGNLLCMLLPKSNQ